MQLAILGNQQLTMGTREIAEMLGKNHSDIKRSAYRLAESGVIGGCQPLAESPYTHEQNGQTYSEYRLNKRDSLVLVAQNCPEFTAAIVDRWQELEAKQAPTLPNFADPVAAARAWADAVEQKQVAERQLALAAPKVEFVNKYVAATGNLSFRQVAKLLKVKEPELRDFLLGRRIMYRLAGVLTPYAEHIEAGRFEVKAGVADHGDSSHAYSQVKMTPKGVEWLAGELAKHNARMAVAANDNGGEA